MQQQPRCLVFMQRDELPLPSTVVFAEQNKNVGQNTSLIHEIRILMNVHGMEQKSYILNLKHNIYIYSYIHIIIEICTLISDIESFLLFRVAKNLHRSRPCHLRARRVCPINATWPPWKWFNGPVRPETKTGRNRKKGEAESSSSQHVSGASC